jgi:hypothetical protein
MNIIAALDDRNLLGASIRAAESWKPWRALLAATCVRRWRGIC